jgi:excisionase family DNA binding protein
MTVVTKNLDPQAVTEVWITTQDAEKLTGYSRAHLRKLALRRRVPAWKLGRDWLLHRESLMAHQTRMQALGEQRHNPWRDDLTESGRGRLPEV